MLFRSQYAAVGLLVVGTPWPSIVLLVWLLNARHLLYSASIAPYTARLSLRLRAALVPSLRRTIDAGPNNAAHRIPRQSSRPADRFDRLALDEIQTPYLRYRLHCHHPGQAPCRRTHGAGLHQPRVGSKLMRWTAPAPGIEVP